MKAGVYPRPRAKKGRQNKHEGRHPGAHTDSREGAKRDVDVHPLPLYGVERVAPGLAVPSRGVVAASRTEGIW